MEKFKKSVSKRHKYVTELINKHSTLQMSISQIYCCMPSDGLGYANFYAYRSTDVYKNRLVDFSFISDGRLIASILVGPVAIIEKSSPGRKMRLTLSGVLKKSIDMYLKTASK